MSDRATHLPGPRIRRLVYLLVVAALAVALAIPGFAAAQGGEFTENGEQLPPGSSGNRESVGISDSIDNVAPESLSNSEGTYWQKYPLSRYGLDYHVTGVSFDVGGQLNPFDSGEGVDFSGIPALIAAMIVKVIWYACMYAAYAALALFAFAFDFNLLTGSDNAVNPISGAIQAIDEAIGLEFLAIAITIFGLWAMWRALVQRRYGEAVGGFVGSGAVLLVALAFTLYADDVIGFASDTLDSTSQKFLAIGSALAPEETGARPEIDAQESAALDADQVDDATVGATDALFKLMVYDSFTVLNFGGLKHCASVGNKLEGDEAPISRPPTEQDCPDQNPAMGSGSQGFDLISNSYYANRYLSYNQGDSRRCCDGDKSEYTAIATGDSGRLPGEGEGTNELDPRPIAYPRDLGEQDAPAVDMQQQPAQFQRLGMVALTAFFVFGGVLLIVGLSIAVIVSQLLFLFVLAFAPIIAVISFIPVHGPEIGLGWIKRLAILAGAKLYYSLLLALVIAVGFALLAAADQFGWLMATGLTGLLFWILFFYRAKLQALITHGAASAGRFGMAKYAALGAGLWAGRKVLRGAGAGTRMGARTVGAGARVAGHGARGAASTAMHAPSAARAGLASPGRFRDVYQTGRARGLGAGDSARAAAGAAYDRPGAKAQMKEKGLNKRLAKRDNKRRAAVEREYRAIRKQNPTMKAQGAHAMAKQRVAAQQRAKSVKRAESRDGRKQARIERLQNRSAAAERSRLNRSLPQEEKFRPANGRPSARPAPADGSNGNGRASSNPRVRPRAGGRRSGTSGPKPNPSSRRKPLP